MSSKNTSVRRLVALCSASVGAMLGAGGCASDTSARTSDAGGAGDGKPGASSEVQPLPASGAQPRLSSTVPAWAWSEGSVGGAASGEGLSQVSFAHEGADADPCLTPDGTRLVYSSTQHSNNSDLYMKRVDSRVVSRLTTDPGRDAMPKVSPGGDRIAFASDRGGNWDIFVMPIGGGPAVQVTTESADELHPSWSPDGRFLAFCRLSESSGRWEIWRVPAGGEAPGQFLTYGMFPEWRPIGGAEAGEGERILFQRGRERGDHAFGIWTIDYRDGLVESLTEIVSIPGLACINPSWSPDGDWIAFSTVPVGAGVDRPARADLWLIRHDGEGLVSVASGRGLNLMPAWGAGETVYFVSDRGGAENVWSMPVGQALAAVAGYDPSVDAAAAAEEPTAVSDPSAGEVAEAGGNG